MKLESLQDTKERVTTYRAWVGAGINVSSKDNGEEVGGGVNDSDERTKDIALRPHPLIELVLSCYQLFRNQFLSYH